MTMLQQLHALFQGEVFMLTLVMGSYLLGVWIYKRSNISLLQPLLISMAVLIPFLKWTGMDYSTFQQQTRILHFMLGPSVVALGFVLYEQIEHLRGNVLSILTAVFAGSLVGILSVVYLSKLLGADHLLMASLAPKSVTTPIAISLSEKNGGIPSLTAAFVVLCGLFGGLIGPLLLRVLRIRSKIAKGLAMGSASHALGTVRALELGALEGAISGLAIGIMGVITALLIPLFNFQ